jgi:hypothetical protein
VLFRLSLAPDVQAALRAECAASPLPTAAEGNAPLSADALGALDKLPLLDAVLRETLRLDPPVNATERTPTADVVLPLDTPLVDRAGRTLHALPVPKGAVLSIPIFAINTLTDVWGPDAKAWRPARWTDGGLPDAVKSVPGVFGNVMSFIGGAHGCIGYKFSLYECAPPAPRSTRAPLTTAQGKGDAARARVRVRVRAGGPAGGRRAEARDRHAPVLEEPAGRGRAAPAARAARVRGKGAQQECKMLGGVEWNARWPKGILILRTPPRSSTRKHGDEILSVAGRDGPGGRLSVSSSSRPASSLAFANAQPPARAADRQCTSLVQSAQ